MLVRTNCPRSRPESTLSVRFLRNFLFVMIRLKFFSRYSLMFLIVMPSVAFLPNKTEYEKVTEI